MVLPEAEPWRSFWLLHRPGSNLLQEELVTHLLDHQMPSVVFGSWFSTLFQGIKMPDVQESLLRTDADLTATTLVTPTSVYHGTGRNFPLYRHNDLPDFLSGVPPAGQFLLAACFVIPAIAMSFRFARSGALLRDFQAMFRRYLAPAASTARRRPLPRPAAGVSVIEVLP